MTFSKRPALFFLFCLMLGLTGCAAKQTPQLAQAAPPPAKTFPAMENGSLTLVKPADGPINSAYGMRRHPTQKRKKFHTGIDIGAKRGSCVIAAAPGTVTFSGRQRGYGKTVKVEHPNGLVTLYAHMDEVFVSEGQRLDAAAPIGLVGRTGRTTGPNLHFEVLAEGKAMNPVPETGWYDLHLLGSSPQVYAARPVADEMMIASVAGTPGKSRTAAAGAPEKSRAAATAKEEQPAENAERKTVLLLVENKKQPTPM